AGALTVINGRYMPGLAGVPVVPVLGRADALAAALADLRTDLPDFEPRQLRRDPGTRLTVFAERPDRAALAYHLRLYVEGSRLVLMDSLIDASSGAVLSKLDDLETVQGSGVGVRGDVRPLVISPDASGSGFLLVDASRALGDATAQTHVIKTFTANGGS